MVLLGDCNVWPCCSLSGINTTGPQQAIGYCIRARWGSSPPLLLRARQGGVAPGTMLKVLRHISWTFEHHSWWRSRFNYRHYSELPRFARNVQWWFEGVRSNPHCGLQKISYLPLCILSALPFVAAMRGCSQFEDQRPAEGARKQFHAAAMKEPLHTDVST